MEIIVKKYEHYNRVLGKYISSKKQYFDELKRRGLVTYEEGCRLAESKKTATWIPSKDCIDMGRELMQKGDGQKKIILGQHPRLVEGMKKLGLSFKVPNDLPTDKGGFEDAV